MPPYLPSVTFSYNAAVGSPANGLWIPGPIGAFKPANDSVNINADGSPMLEKRVAVPAWGSKIGDCFHWISDHWHNFCHKPNPPNVPDPITVKPPSGLATPDDSPFGAHPHNGDFLPPGYAPGVEGEQAYLQDIAEVSHGNVYWENVIAGNKPVGGKSLDES